MLSPELKKTLELWSLIATLIIMSMILLLFIFLYATTIRVEGKSEIQANKYIKYKNFGIARQEDIWIDDRDPNNRYTSHGRLINSEQ
jgi:hypothetical protein